MSGRPVRVSFVSGVRHAGPYLEILRHDPRVELVGVAEEPGVPEWMLRDSQHVARRAETAWLPSVDDALDPDRVDLAFICSEPTRHARLAITAMKRGVNVVVDKPVATTLDDADLVLDAARDARGFCSVINRTHSPALRRTRRYVDAGYLGLPRHLDVEFLASGRHFSTSVERPGLVIDPALSGGGELLNFLGYCVDAVRYLTGLEVESVYAMTGALFGAGHADRGVEDTAVVSLGLEHGVTCTVTVGRVAFAPGLGPTSSSIRLLGSHGHAVVDDDKPAVLRYGGHPALSAHPVGGDGSAVALRLFLDHVVGRAVEGRAPDYGLADARAGLAVIDAAYRSVASRAVCAPAKRGGGTADGAAEGSAAGAGSDAGAARIGVHS
ncbi:Gfo/Idh/MocA family protein [Subtercola vilae]|uniref:Gfo/Idh/MocA family oxidoreductase n=1 Tax=Subtercola vilae TaxID=2056433 RepID=A0A4T2CCA0_9MICO|nr:Gfo/Idh/MocA family oxidoreductase [Subtercola vilae]TIH40068.1 gfo/Idh/MocA family oxidoreductase [Subtercola vilae]